MLFHKLRFKVRFPRTLWMPNPCSHSLPNSTFRICTENIKSGYLLKSLYCNLLIVAICISLNFQSEGFRFRTRKYPESSTVDKFASCSPVWRWSSTAATAWLDFYSWSTVLRLQLWLMLYSSAYASTALLTLLQRCLGSTALAYAL